MVKCPKCKKEITYLHSYSEFKQTFEIDEDGFPRYSVADDGESDGRYECPECSEELCDNDEEEAIKFLKGKED